MENLVCRGSSVFFHSYDGELPLDRLSAYSNLAQVVDATDEQIRAAGAVVLINKRHGVAKVLRLLIYPVHGFFRHVVGANHHLSHISSKLEVFKAALWSASLIEGHIHVVSRCINHTAIGQSVFGRFGRSESQLQGIVHVTTVASSDYEDDSVFFLDVNVV